MDIFVRVAKTAILNEHIEAVDAEGRTQGLLDA
jgi:hypothetical protein